MDGEDATEAPSLSTSVATNATLTNATAATTAPSQTNNGTTVKTAVTEASVTPTPPSQVKSGKTQRYYQLCIYYYI